MNQNQGRIDMKTKFKIFRFDPERDKFTTRHYGLGINTQRYELFAKTGYVFPAKKYKSIGLQLLQSFHRQNT